MTNSTVFPPSGQRPRLRGVTRFLRECLKFASRALDHPFQICDELTVQLVVRLAWASVRECPLSEGLPARTPDSFHVEPILVG